MMAVTGVVAGRLLPGATTSGLCGVSASARVIKRASVARISSCIIHSVKTGRTGGILDQNGDSTGR